MQSHPAPNPQIPPPADPHPLSEAQAPERVVLLVDDVEQVVAIAGDYLERRLPGVRVVTHTSPHAALAWLRGAPRVDLVLSDNHMADMDGLELLARARELRPEAARALMTAYLDLAATPQELGRMGLHALIRKPWEWPELARFVGRLLGLPQEERARLEREGPIPFPATAFQELAAHRAGQAAAAGRAPPRMPDPSARPPEEPAEAPPRRARPWRDALTGSVQVACPACGATLGLDLDERAAAHVPAPGGAAAGPARTDDEEARRILAYLRARPGVATRMKALQPPGNSDPASKPK